MGTEQNNPSNSSTSGSPSLTQSPNEEGPSIVDPSGGFDSLLSLAQKINAANEPRSVIETVLRSTSELFHAEACSLALVDEASEQLMLFSARGDQEMHRHQVPQAPNVVATTLQAGDVAVVADRPQPCPELDAPIGGDDAFQTRSLLCAVLKQGGKSAGTIQIHNPQNIQDFSGHDEHVLTALSTMTSSAIQRAQAYLTVRRTNEAMWQETHERHHMVESSNNAMKKCLDTLRRAAGSSSTILLMGESGCGKEVAARSVHDWSKTPDGPFIAINCSALSPALLESELFGHEKGAFTSAVSTKRGKFELAEGGTLFLDEIGEMSLELQAKLLRVLQERQFERVGGTVTIDANVRVVAATNRDLAQLSKESSFREDLYYRLNVITVNLPPLRDRPEDIPDLLTHFIERARSQNSCPDVNFSEQAWQMLLNYNWPGNIRELVNAVERAVVLCHDNVIAPHDLPVEIQAAIELMHDSETTQEQTSAVVESLSNQVKTFKRERIERAIHQAQGNLSEAARNLKMAPGNMARVMRSLGIKE